MAASTLSTRLVDCVRSSWRLSFNFEHSSWRDGLTPLLFARQLVFLPSPVEASEPFRGQIRRMGFESNIAGQTKLDFCSASSAAQDFDSRANLLGSLSNA